MTETKSIATTVRFDPYRWQLLTATCERLGVRKARFITDATLDRIVTVRTVDELASEVIDRLVATRVGELLRANERRLQHVELQLARRRGGGWQ